MKIKYLSIPLVLAISYSNAFGALVSNATLLFDDSVFTCPVGGTPPNCDLGAPPELTSGTFYSFDINNNGVIELSERFAMTAKNGIKLGVAQPASGSHVGPPDGTESTDIDEPWSFFGNTGMHYSDAPVTIVSDDGVGNVLLDMSGWGITWNGIPKIPFGAGSWGSNPEGQAVLTCSTDCSVGDSFILFYTATVPASDPSGFGLVRYRLGFDSSGVAPSSVAGIAASSDTDDPGAAVTGIIVAGASNVPIPAAVWLFGSGLIGLFGVAKHKQNPSKSV